MKTYKEFINKAKPVELDEVCIPGTGTCVAAGAIATAPVWVPTLTAKLTATALAAHGLYKKGKSIYQAFNRDKKSDILSRDDGYWRNTSKAKNTDIPDGIKDDLKGQTFQPDKVDKTNTEVGDGTAVGGQTVAPTISNIRAVSTATDISKAGVKSKKIPFKSFKLKGLKLPTTSHNVGRRVNPQ